MQVVDLIEQLRRLGVQAGSVLVVHTAFSKVGPIEGGPDALIQALQTTVGPSGTLVMPSMSDVDDEPFQVSVTPCRAMGVVADTFWRLPGVLRTDSPHAFAARGPHAAEITAPQPLEIPHGIDSPVGRGYELDARVLLLGIGHDANTTVHLAENLAGVRYRLPCHSTLLQRGQLVRVDYSEVDHCCQNFALLDEWLLAEGAETRGVVGHGEARLARSRDIVRVARAQLAQNETAFLHTVGTCDECDAAWKSLAALNTTRHTSEN
jgi:aminoglycoside 3-N-acetyltransferase